MFPWPDIFNLFFFFFFCFCFCNLYDDNAVATYILIHSHLINQYSCSGHDAFRKVKTQFINFPYPLRLKSLSYSFCCS